MLLGMLGMTSIADDSYVCECTVPTAGDTPNSWARDDMIRAHCAGIIGAALPDGVYFRQGAPRWYIAELLADYMVVYTDTTDIWDVVAIWLDGAVMDPIEPFPDVPETHPQFRAIMALATMGILQGGEVDGVHGFHPNRTLTRAEAAVGLSRMMTALVYTVPGFVTLENVFADWGIPSAEGGIQSWALNAVAFLYSHNVMGNTTSEENLIPDGEGWYTNYMFNPNLGFDTQQLITGMVRMLLDVEWREPPNCTCNPVSIFNIFRLTTDGWDSREGGGGNIGMIINEDGVYTVTNVGGGWPSAAYTLDEILALPRDDWENISLYYDFTVAGATNILLAGADNYSLSYFFSGGTIGTADDDLPAGHYRGVVTLAELFNYTRVGMVLTPVSGDVFTLSDIRIFAIGGHVSFNAFQLVQRQAGCNCDSCDCLPTLPPLNMGRTYERIENADGSVTVTATFHNWANTEGSVTTRIGILGDGTLIDGQDEVTLIVAPEGYATAAWTVEANNGSARLIVSSSSNGRAWVDDRVGRVNNPNGTGWVAGDIHVHSRFSDGSGWMDENFTAAARNGMDFINIADHNNSAGWSTAQTAAAEHNMIPIQGNEMGSFRGHAIFMGVDRNLNYETAAGGSTRDAIALMKEHTNGQGLAFAAHPYDGTGHPNPWGVYGYWDSDIDGIEVWNGWYAGNHWANVRARQTWDNLNNQGRRLTGVATTDAHFAEHWGLVYTVAYVQEQTAEGILDAFRQGNMFGTNGPVISLYANEYMMGDDTREIMPEGEYFTVNLSGYYINDLARVLLIKNGEIIEEFDLGGAREFDEEVEIFVYPGDFIRMEVEGVETLLRTHTAGSHAQFAYAISAPFAFSNPIFFGGERKGNGNGNGGDDIPYADRLLLNVDFADGEAADNSPIGRALVNNTHNSNVIWDATLEQYIGVIGGNAGNAWAAQLTEAEWTSISSGVTLEVSFRMDSPVGADWRGVFGSQHGAGLGLWIWDTHNPAYITATVSAPGWQNIYTGGVAVGNWVHAVMTFNGSSLQLYVNGVFITAANTGALYIPDASTNYLVIGGDTDGEGGIRFPFDGAIGVARMWDTVLTSSQIATLANLSGVG